MFLKETERRGEAEGCVTVFQTAGECLLKLLCDKQRRPLVVSDLLKKATDQVGSLRCRKGTNALQKDSRVDLGH